MAGNGNTTSTPGNTTSTPSIDAIEEPWHNVGPYGFSVCAGMKTGDQKVIPKNVNFTYSEKLSTLFVKRNEKCPFEIGTSVALNVIALVFQSDHANGVPPYGTKIKVNVYSETPKKCPRVMRCHNHIQSELDHECISPWHFVRCDNVNAFYDCDEKTGELPVYFPFERSSNGEMNVENLVFLCNSSCIKGRKISLKFSLMNSERVLGHHRIKLHVCCTPGRDRELHEKAVAGMLLKKNGPSKKRSHDHASYEDRPDSFRLTIKGRKNFNLLKKLDHLLDLEEAIPVEVQEKWLKRHRAQKQVKQSTQTVTNSTSSTRDIPSTSSDHSSDTRYTYRRIILRR